MVAVPGSALIALVFAAGLAASPAWGVTLHQRDDFQDGTTQGWTSGGANPNPPSWVADGGPAGEGDGFLRVEGNGSSGSGGNLVAFNTEQWSGDYLDAGVGALRLRLRNLGSSELRIRLLLESPAGGLYAVDTAELAVGSGWQEAVLRLDPSHLAGPADPWAVLASVSKLRILHAPTTTGAEAVSGVLGLDDVTSLSTSPCEQAGLQGAAFGLCVAYCDALACDADGSATACQALAARYEARTGVLPPCTLPDLDRDGVEDELDNCPEEPNPDQQDQDADGFGDLCDNCPERSNPGQEDSFGEVGVGDACDCPCFTSAEVEDLVETLGDTAIYQDLACVDTRVVSKPLTFVAAVRRDGLDCASETPECSALAVEFTEDSVCQLNAPVPAPGITVQGIGAGQREACRVRIVTAAEASGLVCN